MSVPSIAPTKTSAAVSITSSSVTAEVPMETGQHVFLTLSDVELASWLCAINSSAAPVGSVKRSVGPR